MSGGESVYCLVTQSSDAKLLASIRASIDQSKKCKQFAASPLLVHDRSLNSEPFSQAGHVDGHGNLIVHKHSMLRTGLGQANKERREACGEVPVVISARPHPASQRTQKMPASGTPADFEQFLEKTFAWPGRSGAYVMSSEELCDIVECFNTILQAYSCSESSHFSGDSFSVVLIIGDPKKEGKIVRFSGLFPFASEPDAQEFCRVEWGASMWGLQGKFAMNLIGQDRTSWGFNDSQTSKVDAASLWERVCRRRAELAFQLPTQQPSTRSVVSKKWWEFWK